MYIMNSTFFGSTIIRRTSCGVDFIRILIMIEFTHTDLPEPVVPAMSKCGIFAMLHVTIAPLISLPRTVSSFLSKLFLNSVVSTSSRKNTVSRALFGTSIPTADLFGIGASIRTPAEARFSAISSCKPVILDIFTPGAG